MAHIPYKNPQVLVEAREAVEAKIKRIPECRIKEINNNQFKLICRCDDVEAEMHIATVKHDPDSSMPLIIQPRSTRRSVRYKQVSYKFIDRIHSLIYLDIDKFRGSVKYIKKEQIKRAHLKTIATEFSDTYGIPIKYDDIHDLATIQMQDINGTEYSFKVDLEKQTVSMGNNFKRNAQHSGFCIEVPLHVFINFKKEMDMTNLII
jgi:hypothetical protein